MVRLQNVDTHSARGQRLRPSLARRKGAKLTGLLADANRAAAMPSATPRSSGRPGQAALTQSGGRPAGEPHLAVQQACTVT